MNKNIITAAATIIFSMMLGSCSQEILDPSPPYDLRSRATTPGESSETNPTLLTDWENCRSIVLSSVAANGENELVYAPWINGSNTSLDDDFRTDIKKEDGWIMLFHTFCKTNLDSSVAYMFFYNRYSGYAKVFSYNPSVTSGTKSIWRLGSNRSNAPSSIFNETEYFSHPLNDTNPPTVWTQCYENFVTEDNSGLQNGWNGFQFRIGEYNPHNTENTLDISASNIIYTDFKFEGEENSTIKGKITTVHTKDKSIYNNAITDAVLNKGGETIKPLVDSIAEKIGNKKILGLNIREMITNLTATNYGKLLKSGLSLFYKGFVKEKTSYSVSEVNLQSHGTLTISGTGVTEITSGVAPINFNLDSILSYPYGGDYATLSEYYGDKIELGVWTLKNKPTLYYQRYTKYTNLTNTDYDSGILEFNGECEYPEMRVGDVEVVFNPAIKNSIKDYNLTLKMVDVEGGNRVIDNSGKNLLHINYVNKLQEFRSIEDAATSPVSDKIFTIYGVSPSNSDFKRSVYGMIDGLNPGITLNGDTQFYLDWGENIGGNRAAVITLTMTVVCHGEEVKYTDSRLYDVNYAPDPSQESMGLVNTPPYSFILNHKDNNFYGFDLK